MIADVLERELIDGVSSEWSPGLSAVEARPRAESRRVQIRSFSERDRGAIRRICCETGFLGEAIDPIFKDREPFADLFTNAYLDYEPDWCWVAQAGGQIVGYLIGSVSRIHHLTLLRCGLQISCKMLFRLSRGRYVRHPRSGRFVRWLLTLAFQEQPKHLGGSAHLHLNIQRAYRGRGVGFALWQSFEQKLKKTGAKRYYGAFLSYKGHRPESAYHRYGFRVFDRRPTSMFWPEIQTPIEVVCMCKDLGGISVTV